MEQEKDNNQEEYYAAVIWKDAKGETHVIGTLAYFEGKYYFKYEQTVLNEILKDNPAFTGVGSFGFDKLTISENALFTFFQLRVPAEIREKTEAIKTLIETRGGSQTDSISVCEIDEMYQPGIKAEMQRIEQNQLEAKRKEEGLGK